MTNPEVTDVKAALTAGLTELRLPTVRHCYEETARLAERETLSYERYLLQLVTRECEDRQRKRIERLLHQSRIPAEKVLSNFSLKRLPPKVALITKTLLEGEFLDRREKRLGFRQSWKRKNASALRYRAGTDCARTPHLLHHLGLARAGPVGRQTGSETEPIHQAPGRIRGPDYR